MDKTRITKANKQHARRSAGAGEIKEISMSDLIDRQQAIDDIWTVSPLAPLDREWVDRWLRQLPPANCSEFPNNSDIISRQAAIEALERTKRIASYELHGGEVLRTFNVVLNSLINIMSLLPPANNSEIPNSSDTISRQAAIETVMECYDNAELFEVYEEKLRELPPAQPQRIKGKWALQSDDYHEYYECDQCGIAVGIDDIRNFCPNCGADMREVTT